MIPVLEHVPVAPPRHQDTLRLVLVGDHVVVRKGLHALLALEAGVEIVGEAGNAIDGIDLVQRLTPDVVITDIDLPAQSGIYLIAELRKWVPASKGIVLTMLDDEAYVRAAFSAGARGYVLQNSCREDLMEAIRAVCAGHYHVCAPIFEAIVLGHSMQSVPVISAMPDCLTKRQREIIRLVALGRSSKRIAFQLGVSAQMIAKHRANLSSRLDLHSTAAITTYAIRYGLVSQVELASVV